jgi:diketogulonate reductase-like aldo/keto reductase
MDDDSLTRRDLISRTFTAAILAMNGSGTDPSARPAAERPANGDEPGGRSAPRDRPVLRVIPSSGEAIPSIGLGTWQTFDVGDGAAARAPLRTVLGDFVRLGGSVVDSSPMYRKAETVVGDLQSDLGLRADLFIATKVWTRGRTEGIRQMETSMRELRTDRIDLMQVHNLVDVDVHIETLNRWKQEDRIRYVGVTHYNASAYDQLERVLARHRVDFVQLNYSLGEREAERRLLPFAHDRGIAVLVNRPFASGGMFSRVRGRPLPSFAAELGIESWAQFFLKWISSHPSVTCAIPATSSPDHLADNMRALHEPLPDEAMRARMVSVFDD